MKVIEITGLPKAGKTTLVNRLAVRLRNQGFRVKKYPTLQLKVLLIVIIFGLIKLG